MPIGYSGAPRVTGSNQASRTRRLSRSLTTGNNGTPMRMTLFSSEQFNYYASPVAANTDALRPIVEFYSTEFPVYSAIEMGYYKDIGYLRLKNMNNGAVMFSYDIDSGFTFVGDLGITGNVQISGTLNANGAVQFNSTLNAVGAVIFSNTLNTAGTATFTGAVNVNTIDGIDINPGSDTDADLVTVGVTGAPRIWWDEAPGRFVATEPMQVLATTSWGANTSAYGFYATIPGYQIPAATTVTNYHYGVYAQFSADTYYVPADSVNLAGVYGLAFAAYSSDADFKGRIATQIASAAWGGIAAANASAIITNCVGMYSGIYQNTGQINASYLFRGEYLGTGATMVAPYGIYLSGENNNYMSGNLGVGTAPTGAMKFYVTANTAQATSGAWYGTQILMPGRDITSTETTYFIGEYISSVSNSYRIANTYRNNGYVLGSYINIPATSAATFAANATLATQGGQYISTGISTGLGTINNSYGTYVLFSAGAGTIVNAAGYRLGYAEGAGTITTKWGLYFVGEDRDYLQGNLQIANINGIDILPGSDVNTDLITVGVTGTPTFLWNETLDSFQFKIGTVSNLYYSPTILRLASSSDAAILVDSNSTSNYSSFEMRLASNNNERFVFIKQSHVHPTLPDAVYMVNYVNGSAVGTYTIYGTGSHYFAQGANTMFWQQGGLVLSSSQAKGMDVNPLSDINTDLITVGVTGAPRVFWNEGEDAFELTHNIKGDADLYFSGDGSGLPFCGCYGNEIGWTQASAVANTWYAISSSNISQGEVNNAVCVNGVITVGRAGRYLISYGLSVECSILNKHVQTGIMVNSSTQEAGTMHYEVSSPNAQIPISAGAILDLAANSTVQMAIRTTDTGTPDLSVDHYNLTVTMVGGT